MICVENSRNGSKNASLPSNGMVNRDVIVQWLREDILWLRMKARNKNPLKNPIRVKLIRASIYGCSVLLQMLRDKELDELKDEIDQLKATVNTSMRNGSRESF